MNPFDLLRDRRINDPTARRSFIERCAKAALGLTILPHVSTSRVASAAAPEPKEHRGFGRAKNVIWIRMAGGLSHVDSLDPKSGAAQGPAKAIGTTADFQMTEFFPQLAKAADKLCVIRSMTANIGIHDPAQYLMRTGNEQRGVFVHPAMGAWCRHFLGPSSETLPSSVCVNVTPNRGNGFFPAAYSPLPVLDPNSGLQHAKAIGGDERLAKRLHLADDLDEEFRKQYADANVDSYSDFYDETVRLLRSSELNCFDLSAEPEAMRAAYGPDNFGQGCLLARRLVESGVRFIEVVSEGWDMHYRLEEEMNTTGAEFDHTLAALLNDLQSRGLLDSTLVAVTTEFGRRPNFDGGGRGHHPPAFSMALAGGGVKGGYVYGATDERGATVTENPVSVASFHATVGWAAGLPLDEEAVAYNGRPFTVGNKEKPVLEIFT